MKPLTISWYGRHRTRIAQSVFSLGLILLSACVQQSGPQINPGDTVRVALLTPKSDENLVSIAQSLENAAQLAADDLGAQNIALAVYDTAGTEIGAKEAAKMAQKNGAQIIIGPLRGQSSLAAASATPSMNVLSFSNDASIAGGNLYVLGATWENAATRLLNYAASQGRVNIVTLYPNTTEGQIAKTTIEKAALNVPGITLAPSRSFTFSQEGVVELVAQIRADYMPNLEDPSYIPQEAPDAFFLTSNTAGALPLLAELLSDLEFANGGGQLIGLTRWDQPPQTLALPGLENGWFALPDPEREARFNARYSAAFGSQPHQLASLAYDAVAAIGALKAAGRKDALLHSGLTQEAGFFGATGIFRLNQTRTNERALAVAQIQNRNVVILDASPNSFAPR